MAVKIHKTNAMRMLDRAKVEYKIHEYPTDGSIAATDVARLLNEPTERVFKTLVTTDNNKNFFVFCVPSEEELDLKAAARTAGVKKIEMLKQKDLFPLTGYVHGGCSPVGMKKQFPTFIHETAKDWESIYVSGGKIGLQIEINPLDLEKLINAKFASFIKAHNE
ncbi:Cys-tRNA(Pro) deacylase [Actinobacillus delphinicola]|uniref:Cys-tRNA(Pro) deacylase n=1 Tax=Actinobacillus delphinicola TaxID=51161 RepID=UPI002441E651|nr:Cys-tRNA(Pro) deacylase [Actinobacillus delphinicola]